jgi:hypothetical protein
VGIISNMRATRECPATKGDTILEKGGNGLGVVGVGGGLPVELVEGIDRLRGGAQLADAALAEAPNR